MKYRLILASGSPRRKELLEQIGAEFEILPAKGEEVITSTIPSQVVMELSSQKAEEVAGRFEVELGVSAKDKESAVIILGADTVVAYDDQILGKPKNKEDAVNMLKLLSGNTHSVFTGVTLIWCKNGIREKQSFFAETKVTMYPLTEQEIQAYVETGEPMDKAGAYGIQGKGAVLVEKIDGDYNNVVGLPVAMVCRKLSCNGWN